MNTPSVFSIAFIVACAISVLLGIFTLNLNARGKTNILFFILSMTLGVWAFGFGMAVVAHDDAAALFWRRFAAIGWGVFFSVMLHFFHVFTDHQFWGKKRFPFLLLIYLPSLITYLGFTYIPYINPDQYNLVQTSMGWVNVASNNGWDWFYTGYYVTYSLSGFYLIWRWGRTSQQPYAMKQSMLILSSFVLTMLLGSLTDILGNSLFSVRIPQLAPLLMVFPALIVYYSVRRYGLFKPRYAEPEDGLMTDQIRTRIIRYISNAFVLGSLLNIISQYLLYNDGDIVSVLIFSGLLVFMAMTFLVIQRSRARKNTKDILNALVLALSVPVITLRFISFASVTIWAFPFLLLIITLVFGKSYIQTALSVSIVMTQVIVWIIKPEITLTIDAVDHVVRLVIFLLAIWFAHDVRRIYQSKLNENAEQIRSQQIIMDISSDFGSANERHLDDKIMDAMRKISGFMKVRSVFVFSLDDAAGHIDKRFVMQDGQINTTEQSAAVCVISDYPGVLDSLRAGKSIVCPDSFGNMAVGAELNHLLGCDGKAFVVMPIVSKGAFSGFIGVETERQVKRWSDTQLSFLRIIGNSLGDAFEKVEQEKEITQMAYYDDLTKLPSRIMFKESVSRSIKQAEHANETLSVIFLDLDAFKSVNDSVGHDGGDRLIVKVSEKLLSIVQKTDTVSRFGGDEFLILLGNLTSPDDIVMNIERIMSIFDDPFVINEQEYFVTASAGIAVYPYDGTDPEALIKNADIAMYKAKDQGKNQYMFCTSDMKDEIVRKLKLTNSLYRALERQEFELFYQPQINIRSKGIIGAEALIRWFHPEYNLISPGVFIPLAEQTGLIGPIGDWVLRTACLQCKSWQQRGLPEIQIAVNVSIQQLKNPYFVYRVQQILEEIQLEPQYLELEVTESATINESDDIIEILERLRALGVSISMDDFGTAYSSLSRLTAMPIDRLKLDMQFVRGIGRSEKENAIIKGIIGLAHSLGLKVIAEGVETEPQFEFLEEKECDEIQGYLYYRPVNAETLERILAEKR